jgi:two-component system, LytTR family, sensor kinase
LTIHVLLIDPKARLVYLKAPSMDAMDKRKRFDDIYPVMTKRPDIQRVKLYLWIALAFTMMWIFHYLVTKDFATFLRWVPNELWRNSYLLVVNFIFFEYAWASVWKKRRYLIYNLLIGIFLIWILSMFLSYGLYGWRELGIALGIYTPFLTATEQEHIIAYQAQGGFASLFFFGIIRHIYDHRRLQLSAQKLRIEKQQAELSYLKSQTNPHFLFNTLNNIYALSREKSDRAPESVLRLSKILRYMLYETGGDYIAIEQELKIITDYIELEKLRYDESLHVNFNHDVENLKQALPPLLLIPLVENAFKHGVSETRGRPFVDIHLSVNNRQLLFTVKNSADIAVPGEEVKENIGLSNLRRQLELLYTDYQLLLKPEANQFTAILKINLASHVKDQMHHH